MTPHQSQLTQTKTVLKDGQVTLQTWNNFLTIFSSVAQCKYNQANGMPIEKEVAEIDQFPWQDDVDDDNDEPSQNAYMVEMQNDP